MNKFHQEEQFPPHREFVETSSSTRPPNLNPVFVAKCGCPVAHGVNAADKQAQYSSGGPGGGMEVVGLGMQRSYNESDDPNAPDGPDNEPGAQSFLVLAPEHTPHIVQQIVSPRPQLILEAGQANVSVLNVWLFDQAATNSFVERAFHPPCDIDDFYPTPAVWRVHLECGEYPERSPSPAESILVHGYSRPHSSMSSMHGSMHSSIYGRFGHEPPMAGSWIELTPAAHPFDPASMSDIDDGDSEGDICFGLNDMTIEEMED